MRIPMVAVSVAAQVAVCGCGGVPSSVLLDTASSRVEEARAIGAAQAAPYEYYRAKEHLDRSQASESSGSDGAKHAEQAGRYASEAIELTEAARCARP